MIKFSKEKVLLLHQLIAEETGGSIGIRLTCTNEEVAHVGMSIADGSLSYEELVTWIQAHEN